MPVISDIGLGNGITMRPLVTKQYTASMVLMNVKLDFLDDYNEA